MKTFTSIKKSIIPGNITQTQDTKKLCTQTKSNNYLKKNVINL